MGVVRNSRGLDTATKAASIMILQPRLGTQIEGICQTPQLPQDRDPAYLGGLDLWGQDHSPHMGVSKIKGLQNGPKHTAILVI